MTLIPRGRFLDFDNFFENFGNPVVRGESSVGSFFVPRVDIVDRGEGYEITAEMPGIKKDDLDVTLEDGVLTIAAETSQEEKQEKEGKVIRQERRYGKFLRSFNLGDDVDETDIKAAFENGVLTLTAPKVKPHVPKQQRIEIM